MQVNNLLNIRYNPYTYPLYDDLAEIAISTGKSGLLQMYFKLLKKRVDEFNKKCKIGNVNAYISSEQ